MNNVLLHEKENQIPRSCSENICGQKRRKTEFMDTSSFVETELQPPNPTYAMNCACKPNCNLADFWDVEELTRRHWFPYCDDEYCCYCNHYLKYIGTYSFKAKNAPKKLSKKHGCFKDQDLCVYKHFSDIKTLHEIS